MTFHRLLLRLLPRRRRERYGDELSQVFASQLDAVPHSGWRRHATTLRLWLRECRGVIGFALRDRFRRLRDAPPHRRGPVELRWAWRNLRGRRWRALLIIALLGVAMSANALVFAVADSLVFHRVPFPAADRIVEIKAIRSGGDAADYLTRATHDGWRSQTDLFESVHVYSSRLSLFVAGPDGMEQIKAADITPGLTDALGVVPRWGRPFVAADALERSFHPVLISESLARARFVDPSLAPGQELDAIGLPMRVVGVMGADFRFPTGNERLWRALDPRGPIASSTFAFQSLARIAPAMTLDRLAEQMTLRSAVIGVAAKRGDQYLAVPAPFYMTASRDDQRTMFLVLLGAALCLLLTACANVMNLELAGALRRAHTSAIQLALGASRLSLARVALIEGALLIGAALAFAVFLTTFGLNLVKSILPATLLTATPNVIDMDLRGLAYMTALAILTWIVAAIPVARSTARASTMTLLKSEDRTSTGSRSSRWVRHGLLIAEIAVSVLLAVTGALYAKSYLSLQQLETGFDSANLFEISFELPPDEFRDAGKRDRFSIDVLSRLRSAPGVVAAMYGSPPPWGIYTNHRGDVEIALDDGPLTKLDATIGGRPVDVDAARVLGLRIVSGRWLEPADPTTHVVITQAFARRFWPGVDAVGHRFRLRAEKDEPTRQVVGIVGDLRRSARLVPGPGDREFMYYSPVERVPSSPATASLPAPASTARQVYTGSGLLYVDFSVRVQPGAGIEPVLAAVRAGGSRWRAISRSVDEAYAKMFADVTLSTRLISVFAGIALAVTIAGVYGLMTFVVAGRTREIGIRMALGADRRRIARLVLGSTGVATGAGVVIGLALSAATSRFIEAQLFAVTRTEPSVYATIAALVAGAALLATWRPARQAARVDPAITLRTD